MTTKPFYRKDREYESPIHKLRVSMGLTIKELARQAGTNICSITGLANGTMSPILRSGKLSKSAGLLLEFFKCDVSYLFPRYFCKLTQPPPLADNQITDISVSEYSMVAHDDPADIFDAMTDQEDIKGVLMTLSPRQERVMRLRFGLGGCEELSLAAVGAIFNVSSECIRQIQEKALNRLRYSFRRDILKPMLYPEEAYVEPVEEVEEEAIHEDVVSHPETSPVIDEPKPVKKTTPARVYGESGVPYTPLASTTGDLLFRFELFVQKVVDITRDHLKRLTTCEDRFNCVIDVLGRIHTKYANHLIGTFDDDDKPGIVREWMNVGIKCPWDGELFLHHYKSIMDSLLRVDFISDNLTLDEFLEVVIW